MITKYTAFRCPQDLLELAKKKAKEDRRSLSNYLITLIEKDVKNGTSAEPAKVRRTPAQVGNGAPSLTRRRQA